MKNNNSLQKNIDAWKGVRLSDASRTRIAENLTKYAEFHGVRVAGDSRSIEEAVQHSSKASFVTRLINLKHTPMTALIIAALLLSGGTSFAAENAVPGDALYSMKVGVNEEVKSMFAIGAEAEAKLQADLVKERLEEAETLATEGKLTAQAGADIQSRMEAHAEKARVLSAELDARGETTTAAEVRASLVTTLEAYAGILGGIKATGSTTAQDSLLIGVETEHDATVEAQADADTNLDVSVDGVLDGVIHIKADTNTTSESNDSVEEDATDEDADANLDLDADVHTGTSVDTDIIDLDATTNTSVRTNTGIGL